MATFTCATRLFAALSISFVLVGCSTLTERLDRSMKEAQALNDRCELAADAFPIPASSDEFVEDLLARLKLKIAGLCPAAGTAGALCRPIDLETEIERLEKDAELATENVRKQLKTYFTRLKERARDVARKRNAVRDALGKLVETSFPQQVRDQLVVECKLTYSRHKCAEKLLAILRAAETDLNAVKVALDDLEREIRGFRDAVEDAAKDMGAERESTAAVVGRVFTTLASLGNAMESGATAGTDAWRVLAGGGISDMEREYFVATISFKAAETTLNLIERAVGRVDRMMDKIDDKTYAVSAVAAWWVEDDIQNQIDQIYVRHVRNHFRNTVTVLAFARAACERLAAPVAPNTRPSLVMPFLLQAFTNVEIEENHRNQCLAGKTEVKDIRKCDAYAKDRTFDSEKETMQKAATTERKARLEGRAGNDVGGQGTVAGWAESQRAEEKRAMERQAVALISELAHDQAIAPSDLENLVMRTNAEWSARRQLALAGVSIDEQKVRELGEAAGGEAVYAYHERCAADACASTAGQKALAQALRDVVNNQVNVSVQQYVVQAPSIRNEIRVAARGNVPSARPDPMCSDLNRRDPRIRCTAGPDQVHTLRIDHSFESGQWTDSGVRKVLRDVAEYARARGLVLRATVIGYASSAEFRCAQLKADARRYLEALAHSTAIAKMECSDTTDGAESKSRSGNYFLSLLRAAWAGMELEKHSGKAISVDSVDPAAASRSAPGNESADRQIVVVLRKVPS